MSRRHKGTGIDRSFERALDQQQKAFE